MSTSSSYEDQGRRHRVDESLAQMAPRLFRCCSESPVVLNGCIDSVAPCLLACGGGAVPEAIRPCPQCFDVKDVDGGAAALTVVASDRQSDLVDAESSAPSSCRLETCCCSSCLCPVDDDSEICAVLPCHCPRLLQIPIRVHHHVDAIRCPG